MRASERAPYNHHHRRKAASATCCEQSRATVGIAHSGSNLSYSGATEFWSYARKNIVQEIPVLNLLSPLRC